MATNANSLTQTAESETHYGIAPRLLLAALALSAGGVHLAMVPIHASNSTMEAVGFAVVGWMQILLAVGLLVRPTRQVLIATIAINAAVIATYIVSRTVGLPLGDNSGEREAVDGIDLMTTIFEGALILGAAVLLWRPDFAATRNERDGESGGLSMEAVLIASAVPVLVLIATSVALADPELTQHSHGGAEMASATGHGHDGGGGATDAQLVALAEDRCDLSFNPAAYWRETTLAKIDTLMGGEVAADHAHDPSSAVAGSLDLDKIISQQVTSEGEAGDAAMVVSLSQVSDDVYDDWLRWLASSGLSNHAHGGNELAPDDNKGMGGHLGPQTWHSMTDQGECDALSAELQLARETALKYATVADAKAGGWRQVTSYVPGIAAHFMNFGLVDGKFEIDKPEMLLYDGTGDDARMVGLSYYIRHEGGAEPTQGFTGQNDHYHRHDGLCINATGVIGDSTTTEEECAAMGGAKANGTAGWMSHAWVVPGCESPWGVFSGANPLLDRGLFVNNGQAGAGCAGSGVRARYNLDAGAEENTPVDVGGAIEVASAP